MKNQGFLVVAIAIAVIAVIWTWGDWRQARMGLEEAIEWRNEARSAESNLVSLQSSRDALEFVVTAGSEKTLYDQIRNAQQAVGINFSVKPFQVMEANTTSGFSIGQFRGLSFNATLQQTINFFSAIEKTDPHWLRVTEISITPGKQVERGNHEQLVVQFDLQCILSDGQRGP